jgi:hypothetical protein
MSAASLLRKTADIERVITWDDYLDFQTARAMIRKGLKEGAESISIHAPKNSYTAPPDFFGYHLPDTVMIPQEPPQALR